MRNLFFLLVLFSFSCIAQEGINYQGVATNTSGAELINQNISIQTSIISDSATGNVQWQETHSTTTDQFGLFNLVIGQGASTGSGQSSSFEEIQWGSGNHYLKIEMDATGGSNYILINTSQMMSVPYALYAKNSGSIDSITLTNIINNSNTNSDIYLECVDMGLSIMCGGLGLSSSATLAPETNGYTYKISANVNATGYTSNPHWRKFQIHNISLDIGDKIMIRRNGTGGNPSNPQPGNTTFLEPEIDSLGNVFFYVYAYCSGSCCPSSCNSQNFISMTIPTNNALNFRQLGYYCSYNSSYIWNNWEIFYWNDLSWINTGAYLNFSE